LPLGLYTDLAIGSEGAGFESWLEPDLYPKGIAQGLPPGVTTPNGQNWGFTPPSPHKLQEKGYQPFIDVMRANMRYAGAIRIDHLFGLQRAFWIPTGAHASDALYMNYPLQDLLGIIALESHRNHCLVIGEDLGLPPEGFEQAVDPWKLYSYKLVHYANKQLTVTATPSNAYKRHSITVFSNHDKQTLKGFLTGWYPKAINKLGVIDDAMRDKMLTQREKPTMVSILGQLQAEGFLDTSKTPEGWFEFLNQACQTPNNPDYQAFVVAMHTFLAQSSAKLVGIQLEDIFEMDAQMNIPGTVDGPVMDASTDPKTYPDWRQKLPYSLEEYPHLPLLKQVMQAFAQARGA
jgi:4-alpha-glucanotransferase